MLFSFFPLAREKNGISLVHQDTLAIHLALLKHANVALQLFHVLQLTKAILLAVSKLAHILEVARVNLAEAMQITVPEFSFEHLLVTRLIQQALSCAFAVLPLAFVDVA